MYKNGEILLSDWYKGQADSPYLGPSSIRNCEVFDVPGVLKMTNASLNDGLTYGGMPIARLIDPYGNIFVLDQGGKLWKNGAVIQSGLGVVWDMCVYKNYLLIRHGTSNGVVSSYGPLSSAGAAYSANNFTGLSGVYYGKMLAGQDDIVYIANGATIASIEQKVGQIFDPTNSGTYNYNTSALDLPDNQFAVTMAELGENLMIGTQAGSSFYDRVNFKVGNIYPWDRISPSFSLPIILNECGVQQMISSANKLYVVAGTRGNVYVTDSTNYQKIKRLPWNQLRSFNISVNFFPNAIAFNTNGNLLIGTSTGSDAYGSSSASNSRHGVYEIALSKGYPTVFKRTISTGNYGSTQPLYIGVVFTGASDSTYVGWQDGATYGMDSSSTNTFTGYKSIYESQLMYIADRGNKKKFELAEFKLGKPLISGQGIRISTRKNLTDTYKVMGTYDFTAVGGQISFVTSAKLVDVELLQVLLELTGNAVQNPGDNVELLAVKIR